MLATPPKASYAASPNTPGMSMISMLKGYRCSTHLCVNKGMVDTTTAGDAACATSNFIPPIRKSLLILGSECKMERFFITSL